MSHSKRFLVVVTAIMVVALAFPVVASAYTIYVNKGARGATLRMSVSHAVSHLGTVKKKYKDTSYDETIWVRCFGTKRSGHWSLYLYSNSKSKVTAFIIYSSKYVTKKGIHPGSSVRALKDAYGSSLRKGSGYYQLSSSTGHTRFRISDGKVKSIWIW